jgi:hypothetical protein
MSRSQVLENSGEWSPNADLTRFEDLLPKIAEGMTILESPSRCTDSEINHAK